MILSLPKEILVLYLEKQLTVFFPDNTLSRAAIESSLDHVIERVEHCFSAVQSKHFRINHQTYFNHLNSDHYAMFLYFLANTLYNNGVDIHICEKVFYLNKVLHGIDVFYDVELPKIFLFCHPLGTVLGRGQYSDYLLVYQGCTVGASRELGISKKNEYPLLGKYLSLYMGASVLGNCKIGDNCKISSNSLIMDNNLGNNSIYIGTTTNYLIKQNCHKDAIWGDHLDE